MFSFHSNAQSLATTSSGLLATAVGKALLASGEAMKIFLEGAEFLGCFIYRGMLDLERERPLESLRGCSAPAMPVKSRTVF